MVVAKNPIRSAMGLLLLILSVAGLFLALARAVPRGDPAHRLRGRHRRPLPLRHHAPRPESRRPRATAAAWSCASSAAALFAPGRARRADGRGSRGRRPRCPFRPCRLRFGGIDAFGSVLFSDALVPFELSSALLMVAVVGAIAVARGRQGVALALEERSSEVARAARRRPSRERATPGVFSHEIHVRDAERPGQGALGMIPVEHYIVAERAALRHRGRRLPRAAQRPRHADEHRGDAQRGEPRARRVQPLARRASADRAVRGARATPGRCSPSSSSPPRPPRSPWASPSSSRCTAFAAPSARTRRTS